MNAEQRTPLDDLIRRIGVYLEQKDIPIDPDAPMRDQLPGIDSLRLKELLMYLEEEYTIEFTPAVLEKLETLRDLSREIESLRAG
jgi:acyl carrier protein